MTTRSAVRPEKIPTSVSTLEKDKTRARCPTWQQTKTRRKRDRQNELAKLRRENDDKVNGRMARERTETAMHFIMPLGFTMECHIKPIIFGFLHDDTPLYRNSREMWNMLEDRLCGPEPPDSDDDEDDPGTPGGLLPTLSVIAPRKPPLAGAKIDDIDVVSSGSQSPPPPPAAPEPDDDEKRAVIETDVSFSGNVSTDMSAMTTPELTPECPRILVKLANTKCPNGPSDRSGNTCWQNSGMQMLH